MASGSGDVPMDVGHAHAENDGAWGNEEEWDEEEGVGAVDEKVASREEGTEGRQGRHEDVLPLPADWPHPK